MKTNKEAAKELGTTSRQVSRSHRRGWLYLYTAEGVQPTSKLDLNRTFTLAEARKHRKIRSDKKTK